MLRLFTFIALYVMLLFCPANAGQNLFPSGDSSASGGPTAVFRAIEKGLSAGDVRLIAPWFSPTVPINVRGSAPGYYSANQAGEVLRHFLATHKISSFTFTTIEEGENPFATGAARLMAGGRFERIQLYVRLSRDKSGWVITQFNIY